MKKITNDRVSLDPLVGQDIRGSKLATALASRFIWYHPNMLFYATVVLQSSNHICSHEMLDYEKSMRVVLADKIGLL